MCAISGMVVWEDGIINIDIIKDLNNLMSHRGPDGEGIWQSPDKLVVLGHRRLAILDVGKSGNQPMMSHNGKYIITFNGEIYNFLELRTQLKELGIPFQTESDTEVILAAWEFWGVDMLSKFNGMWSLAIWDIERKSLFISRDRFGVKPLFYRLSNNNLLFSSELMPFSKMKGGETDYNVQTIRRILVDPFSVEGSEFTLLKNIKRLQAGHYGIVENGNMKIKRWWNTLDNLNDYNEGTNNKEKFFNLFEDAVRIRMRSDVRIGTCLSGGFDSTAVACIMERISREKQANRISSDWRHAFVATFPGTDIDERPQAEIAAKYAGIHPHFIEVKSSGNIDEIDSVLESVDDIYIGLPTAIWRIYRELRKNGVYVSIDGHGADELMGAYRQENGKAIFLLRQLFRVISTGGGKVSNCGTGPDNTSLIHTTRFLFNQSGIGELNPIFFRTIRIESGIYPFNDSLAIIFVMLPSVL